MNDNEKTCDNCAWWYLLPDGSRDCAEACENHNNWSERITCANCKWNYDGDGCDVVNCTPRDKRLWAHK